MLKKWIAFGFLAITLTGCNQGEAERANQLQNQVNKLQAEIQALRSELDEERNGAPKLLALARSQADKGDFVAASKTIEGLMGRHPASDEAKQGSLLAKDIDAKIAALEEQERIAREKQEAEKKAALAKLDKNLNKSTDEVREITWISHKKEPVLGNKMALYFGTEQGSAAKYPLRLKFQYYDDDWLFVESVIIKADDKTFDLGSKDFERDNSGGSVWEWNDEPLKDRKMLEAVLTAKKVIVRFNGKQYYKDFVLPEPQKQAMKDIILAWQRYGGKST